MFLLSTAFTNILHYWLPLILFPENKIVLDNKRTIRRSHVDRLIQYCQKLKGRHQRVVEERIEVKQFERTNSSPSNIPDQHQVAVNLERVAEISD